MFGFVAKKLDLFGELVCRTNVLLKKYQKIFEIINGNN